MKKFTSVIFVMLISVGLNAQKISDVGLKLQEMQKKYSEITRFNKKAKTNFTKPDLKSALFSQKLDSTVNQVYDELSDTWKNDYKDEFLYDQEMSNTTWLEKNWNVATHAWDIDFKTDLTYDGNGQVTSFVMHEEDPITHELVANSKYDYYYNSDGMADSVLIRSSEDGGLNWDLLMKKEHHYNASKQLMKTDTWSYDEDEGALVLGSKTEFSYTETGKIKTSISSYLSEGEEYPSSKSEYSYNGSDKVSSVEYSDLNFLTLMIEKYGRDTFQYNVNGDISIQIYSSWNGDVWVDEDRDDFEYGTTNLSDVAFPYFLALFADGEGYNELKYNKKINTINSYEMIDGSWEHTDINTFYYSSGTATGINEFASAGFKFYPNPASETIIFNWRGNGSPLMLKMYQVTGAQVLQQNAWSGKEISVSHLKNGVYFFKLMNGQQTIYTGKIAKR